MSSPSRQRRLRIKRQQQQAKASVAALTRPLKEKGPSGLVKRAMMAWKQGDYDLAIGLFEMAHRAEPNRIETLLDLGRAYGLRYRYEEAAAAFAKALRLSPNNAKTYHTLGETYRTVARFSQAREAFSRAIECNPRDTEALVALAEVCERLHCLNDATEAVERALAIDAKHTAARYLEAKLLRRLGEEGRAETLLREQLEEPARQHEPRWRGWYELAALLDRQGRYDEAMEALLKAKQSLRPSGKRVKGGADLVRKQNREFLTTLNRQHFERWRGDAEILQPQRRLALLCGHPRSGTTLIEQVLDSHPGLVSADETNIISDDVYIALGRHLPGAMDATERLDSAPAEILLDLRARYVRYSEAFLGAPLGNRMLLDKNPELTMILPVINRVFPEMKVLVALRDPRDVCLSCFMQPLPMNSVSFNYLTIEDTVKKYADTMQTWLTLRPMISCPWLETRYEDNIAGLESESRRILGFLGLEWDERVLRYYEHAVQKHVRSPTYEAVTKRVYSTAIGRWRHYERWFGPHFDALDPFVRAFGYA